MKKGLLLLLIVFFLVAGCSVKPVEELTDADRFAKEYNVANDNPFYYVGEEELLELFRTGSAVVFFGNSTHDFCLEAVKLLMEISATRPLEEIAYVDVNRLSNKTRAILEEMLKEQLKTGSDGVKRLEIPDIYFLQEGHILGHSDALAYLDQTDTDYLTAKQRAQLKRQLQSDTSKYLSCYVLGA